MGDLRVQKRDLKGADKGDQAGQQGFGVSCIVRQHGRQTAANERQKQ
jgi:hypothetical protein